MWWTLWWVWAVAALVLGAVEIFAPAYIFLGLGVGAAAVAVLSGFSLFGLGALSLPATLVVFALLSLAAVVVLRQLLGVRDGQVRVWDKDIND